MHASMSFLNGRVTHENVEMLNSLLSGATTQDEKTRQDKQDEKKRPPDSTTGPGSFRNDPDDASNPNEARERHLKKVDKKLDR